jgi:hypothetical protein
MGDFNGDGSLDVVIANTGTPYLTILLGDEISDSDVTQCGLLLGRP